MEGRAMMIRPPPGNPDLRLDEVNPRPGLGQVNAGARLDQVNAGPRLDRLPMSRFHRRILSLVALGMFFDTFDNAMMAGVLATLVANGTSTFALNAQYISVSFFGLTVGAAMAGLMGDRWGRRFAYQFNLLLFGGMCLISAFAPSMTWLIAMRGIMGVGLGAEYVAGYSMITEFIPPARRGRCIALVNVVSSSGGFVVSQVGLFVIPLFGWRAMFVIGGIGALWVWWLRKSLPESPRWLEAVGRDADAERVLASIEREVAAGGELPPVIAAPPVTGGHMPLSVLFKPPVLHRTLLAIAVNVIVLVCSYSFTSWIPTFFVREGFSVTRSLTFAAVMSGGAVAGPLLGFFLADRIGRRKGIVAVAVGAAMIGAVYPFMTTPATIMLVGFLLVGVMNLMITLGLACYTPELFPTAYRFRGSGLGQMMGRGGLIVTPYVVVLLYDTYGIAGVVLVLSGLYLALAAIIALFGIETNQKSLEALAPGLVTQEDLG
jgi:putative MFS transporter